MTEVQYPTRDALEKMCPDKRTVRQFELLFEQVRELEERVAELEEEVFPP